MFRFPHRKCRIYIFIVYIVIKFKPEILFDKGCIKHSERNKRSGREIGFFQVSAIVPAV